MPPTPPAGGLRRRAAANAAAASAAAAAAAAAAGRADEPPRPPPSPPPPAAAAAPIAAAAEGDGAPPSVPLTLLLPLLFLVVLAVASAVSALVISPNAPLPYMDEAFHAPQTRRLCAQGLPRGVRGESWDPKITTPPGLYVLGDAYASLQATVLWVMSGGRAGAGGGPEGGAPPSLSWRALRLALCGEVAALRGLNAVLLPLCLFPCFAVRMGVLGRSRCRRRAARKVGADDGGQAAAAAAAAGGEKQDAEGQQQGEDDDDARDALGTSLAAGVLLPTHFFFGFLYYTDVGALLLLLTAAAALQRWADLAAAAAAAPLAAPSAPVALATLAAAAAGAAATAMRQTNAVWYAFLVGASLLRVAYATIKREAAEDGRRPRRPPRPPPPCAAAAAAAPLRALAALGRHARAAGPLSFAAQLLLLLLPAAAFVAFVVLVNGGRVALGDHGAHDALSTRHWAHPFYAGAFAALAAGAPFFVRRDALLRLAGRFGLLLRNGGGQSGRGTGGRRAGAGARRGGARSPRPSTLLLLPPLLLLAAALLAARYGTVAHPYLLADNRHYTFYAWKRTLGRHWIVRYALAPVWAAAWLLLGSELAAGVGGGGGEEDEEEDGGSSSSAGDEEGALWVLGFACACAATLVPAGLIEPRYYTVPAVLAVLHSPARLRRPPPPPPPAAEEEEEDEAAAPAASAAAAASFDWSALVACVAFSAVNAATLYVFAFRPFSWPDGSEARFMW